MGRIPGWVDMRSNVLFMKIKYGFGVIVRLTNEVNRCLYYKTVFSKCFICVLYVFSLHSVCVGRFCQNSISIHSFGQPL